jgi:hypothetical protein
MENTYQRIKDFIYTNLRKHNGPLPDDQIRNEVETTRRLIEQIGLNSFSKVLPDKTELSKLTEDDWNRLQRELETQFDVVMDAGFLIKDNSATNRDPSWWTDKAKQSQENFYWERFKTYLADSLNSEVIRIIDHDTDVVMNNLEDPSIRSFNRYGMVVGHVQSGKTGNYSALICKAADAGYNFIVVIAGGMNNLRNQTQARLNDSFVGRNLGQQVGVGVGDINRQKLPISLTTENKDFNKQDADTNAQGLNFDNINVPILIVIKKNTKTLSNVIAWLQNQYKNKIANHSMLVIDDESDYASINTGEEDDPTKINEKIRKLISLFQKSVYVAYTATPYANIFIDHEVGHDELGKDLFPKDFIYALDHPTDYLGARKIFLDPESRYLIKIDDYLDAFPAKHKKTLQIDNLPESLKDAIRNFLLNIAIRNLRGQTTKHNSMLIHASRFTNVHIRISHLADDYLNHLKSEIRVYGNLADACDQSHAIQQVKSTFKSRISNTDFSWQQVLKKLTQVISSVVVREVHQQSLIPLVYRKDLATNVIVVGGTSLSRGFTLEGLSISYFLRKSVFYDTLMQMGRWFGYRPGYQDLCKIYLPEELIKSFGSIIEATEDLIDDFKRMSEEQMTPEQFGLAVKYHPDSGLQVTARNKQKNARDIYFEMKLDGHTKETAWIHSNDTINNKNTELLKTFVQNLNSPRVDKPSSSHLWRNINKKKVLELLSNFEVYGDDDELGFRTRMPIKFILKYVEETPTDWDISLHNGSGKDINFGQGKDSITVKKEIRGLIDRGSYLEFPNRKVSSGSAEIIALEENEIKSIGPNPSPKDIAAIMKRPLLMLHLIESKDNPSSVYAAFGICFPGGIKSGTEKTVKLKINKVYLESIQDMLEEDSDD